MRRSLLAVAVTLLVALTWVVVLPSAPVHQPIAFNHAKHQAVGCTVCHRGAATEVRAGIPAGTFCLKCHATAPAGAGAAWDSLSRGGTVRWVQVTHVPDHVMFSHRRHVTLARLDCASCHGQIRDRQTPVDRVAYRLEMNTCLSCHRREGAAEDCAACHR